MAARIPKRAKSWRIRRRKAPLLNSGFLRSAGWSSLSDSEASHAMPYLVTKELLALHDQYDGDLGLLDERWADKRDRERFSAEQMRTLGDYQQQLALIQVDCLAPELRRRVEDRMIELERLIDPDVVATLREREAPNARKPLSELAKRGSF